MGMEEWLKKYPPIDKDRTTENQRKPPSVNIKKIINRLPEKSLDLHGLKSEEAIIAVNDFLIDSSGNGLKKVIIIHGKGYHSEGKPILKKVVYSILEKSPLVKTFGQANRTEGGSGAVYVIIK